jgi:hypothetical protein
MENNKTTFRAVMCEHEQYVNDICQQMLSRFVNNIEYYQWRSWGLIVCTP